jgi:WD40 repeat protein
MTMINSPIILNSDHLRSFVNSLREKSESELRDIISRYISYQPEMPEAALIVSVDRGFISYDLKEKLTIQIMRNFESHQEGIKTTSWEKDNAFIAYVSKYTDDELYEFIDEPSDIVIDVYNAILTVAKERELISDSDQSEFSKDAVKAVRSDDEVIINEYRDFTKDLIEPEENLTEEKIEEEKKKYWVCPKCHEMVEMEMAICWNCQTETPETVEHPDREKVIHEYAERKPFSFTKVGISLVVTGTVLIAFGLLAKTIGGHFDFYRWDGIIFGSIGIIVGVVFLVKGTSQKD